MVLMCAYWVTRCIYAEIVQVFIVYVDDALNKREWIENSPLNQFLSLLLHIHWGKPRVRMPKQ